MSHDPTDTYALLKLVLPLADFIGNNTLSNQNWGTYQFVLKVKLDYVSLFYFDMMYL